MTLPDFLTEWPYGEILVKGHRIGLYHVINFYQRGMNVDQLHEWFPTLEPELIQKVLDFYHANQAEVDRYVAAEREELARREAAAPPVDYEGMRRRAEERKQSRGG